MPLRTVLNEKMVKNLQKLTEEQIRLICDEGRPIEEALPLSLDNIDYRWFYKNIAEELCLKYDGNSIAGPLKKESKEFLKSLRLNPDQEIDSTEVQPTAIDNGKVVAKINWFDLPKEVLEKYRYRYPTLNAHVRCVKNRLGDTVIEWVSYDPTTSWIFREEIEDEVIINLLQRAAR